LSQAEIGVGAIATLAWQCQIPPTCSRKREHGTPELRRDKALGMELAKDVYLLTQNFPRHEMYGLSSQLQRAVVSVPANLAEGHARDSTKEFTHRISIAQGSLAETETHLLLAESLGYAKSDGIAKIMEKCGEERKMLSGLRRSLKSKYDN
jgi:four helix bundle protein